MAACRRGCEAPAGGVLIARGQAAQAVPVAALRLSRAAAALRRASFTGWRRAMVAGQDADGTF